MSSDDEDITRIEDLPDFNPAEEDEESFSSLEDLAAEMGIVEEAEPENETDDFSLEEPPDFPTPATESEIQEDQFSNDDTEFEETEFENTDFDPAEAFSESDFDSTVSDNSEVNFQDEGFDEPSFQNEDFEESGLVQSEMDSNQIEFPEAEPKLDAASEDGPSPFDEKRPELPADEEDTEDLENNSTSLPVNDDQTTPEKEGPALTPIADLASFSEHESDEKVVAKTEILRDEPKQQTEPEDLAEITKFSQENLVVDFTVEGNPPFSLIIKNIKYYEDIDFIIATLKEFGMLENEDHTRNSLINGQLLLPRLSEYVAIIFAHKVRMLDCEILMGLTEEINPPKSYQSNDKGLTTKHQLRQNKKHHYQTKDLIDKSAITISTLSNIDGLEIVHHLGVITATRHFVGEYFDENENHTDQLAGLSEVIDGVPSLTGPNTLNSTYGEMIMEIREKALKQKANGVIGIQFSITPLNLEDKSGSKQHYQILCSGSLVWLEKK